MFAWPTQCRSPQNSIEKPLCICSSHLFIRLILHVDFPTDRNRHRRCGHARARACLCVPSGKKNERIVTGAHFLRFPALPSTSTPSVSLPLHSRSRSVFVPYPSLLNVLLLFHQQVHFYFNYVYCTLVIHLALKLLSPTWSSQKVRKEIILKQLLKHGIQVLGVLQIEDFMR